MSSEPPTRAGSNIGFRATPAELEIIEAHRGPEESISDVIRRALHLLDRAEWEERAHQDMYRVRDEDLSEEPDAWEYAEDGSIRLRDAG